MKRVLLLAILGGLALWRPQLGNSLFRQLEIMLERLARRPIWALTVVALFSLLLSGTIPALIGFSPPHVHDEFANLLAADTFAHGRATNPTHPLWVFFEGIHIIQQPSYMSKYPVAQGLLLALGQVLTGQPAVGLWLSAALACMALCWMLQAWVPARWALLGGLLAATHPVILKWSQVYWGGLEAVTGGALILGAFRRILDGPRTRDGILAGIGLALLANSRPYEGFVLSVIVIGTLLVIIGRRKSPMWPVLIQRVVLPVAVVMSLVLGLLGYYNYRVTGNPLHMPYMEYEKQYAVAPFMVWQKPRPEPVYRHPFIRDHMVKYALGEYEEQQTLSGFLHATWQKFSGLTTVAFWYFHPALVWLAVFCLPLIALLRALPRDRWLKLAALIFSLFMLALVLETWMWDRYAAPIAAVVLLLIIGALRQLKLWQWRGKPVGLLAARIIVLLCLAAPVPWTLIRARECWADEVHATPVFFPATHLRTEDFPKLHWDWQRQAMIRDLTATGGKYLIIVRYNATQRVHDDWVHNAADIDGSPVIWARDMGPEQNLLLLAYYREHQPDRQIWLLEPGQTPPKLVPYYTGTPANR